MTYIRPITSPPLPGNLSLTQFIQTLLVGVSGFDVSLVRPSWQRFPPKQPDIDVDWMAFAIIMSAPNIYAYTDLDKNQNYITQRHQDLKLTCSVYGPNAMDNASLIQDGLQLGPNLSALTLANMGFVSTGEANHIPDLVNERWVERVIMDVFLRREIQRVYPVLSFVSANGIIHTTLENETYLKDWQT